MNYETLLIHTKDHITLITINRPKALNAINERVMSELGFFFSEGYKTEGQLHGVVITGAGEKAFVAGADIKEFADLDKEAGSNKSKKGHIVYRAIELFHVPVIAAVNGFALGGGCELAMACHMRIAGEHARFGQPEVNLGLIPGYGGTQRLIQLIGKGKAMELLLTADMIKAPEALQLGLVNHIVPSGEEVSKSKEIIAKCGSKGPLAITQTIQLVDAYFNKQVDGFALEVDEFGKAIASEDCKEGAAAFVEKRKAEFKGK